MSSIRYEILLPLQYNDGTAVEDEKFEQTWADLVAQFQALTIQPQSFRGIWMHEGERYEDNLIRLILDVPDTPETEQFFKAYKETLKERFKQLDVWITAYSIRII